LKIKPDREDPDFDTGAPKATNVVALRNL
jgi:hypothetical protein